MKRIVFYISLLAIPFVILLALEGALRAIGFGKDYSLLKRQGNSYILNPDYPAKFFSQNDISVPEFIPQRIPVKKAPNEVRIICLGGSTTEGFPFEVNINFPHFLQCYLKKQNPQKQWRVINLGLSAINSHSVRDMVPQISELKPDAVLIYMGHNEFYGALGLASNSVIGSDTKFVQLYLWLKNWRLYQLLESIVFKFKPKAGKHPATLMAAMIKKSHIVPGRSLYKKTLHNFKTNLNVIIKICASQNIAVYVSTLVSNLKDQAPLGYPNPDSSISRYPAIRQALNHQQWSLADSLLTMSIQKDSLNPLSHFLLAQVYYQNKQFAKAGQEFILAKDLDQIPFRAPSDMNNIIRKVCQETQARLVKTDSLFRVHSPHGIPDSTLFLEHLHPNASGYQWLAVSFFQALEKTGKEFGLNKNCIHFTNLDIAIGEVKIADLVKHPPFNGRTHFRAHHFQPELIQQLSKRHVHGHLLWDAAHLQLGVYWQQKNEWRKALQEYSAILQADSLHFSALYKIGDILFRQKQFKQAIRFYQKALTVNPKAAFLKAKLARVMMLNGNESQAVRVLNSVINDATLANQLNKEQKAGVLYLKAIALAKLGKTAEARKLLEQLADEFPKQFKMFNKN